MSPDQPGARHAPRDRRHGHVPAGGRAGPTPAADASPAATPGRPAPRRRLLDDPDPDGPKAARRPKVAGPQGAPHRPPHRAVVGAQALGAVLPVDLPDHLRGVGRPLERGPQRRAPSTTSRASSRRSASGTARTSRPTPPPRRPPPRHDRRRRRPGRAAAPRRPRRSPATPRRRRPRSPTRTATAPRASASSAGSSSRTSRSSRPSRSAGWCWCWPGAAASVVLALLFNLISDLTGGVRVTVLEEEPARPRTGSPAPTDRD